VPLLTIASDVEDVLSAHGFAAVAVGLGLAAVGRGVAVVRGAAGAVVAACVGADVPRTAARVLATADGAADVAATEGVVAGEPSGAVGESAARTPLLPPLQAARATAQRARQSESRRSDISPFTRRGPVRFS